MAFVEKPAGNRIAEQGGGTSLDWAVFFERIVEDCHFQVLPSFTVANLPTNVRIGSQAYVSDETGGAVPAFYDGTNWRRVTDRAVVS